LSPWYLQSSGPQGLLLSVTNLDERKMVEHCRRLVEVVRKGS